MIEKMGQDYFMETFKPIGILTEIVSNISEYIDFYSEDENGEYSVHFPGYLFDEDEEEINCEGMVQYLMKHNKDLYDILEHGDIIKNESANLHKDSGLLMVRKKDGKITIMEPDIYKHDYYYPPEEFAGFRGFVPGYHREYYSFHIRRTPIDQKYLRMLEIKKIEGIEHIKEAERYSECEYRGHKILIIYPERFRFEENIRTVYADCYRPGYEDLYHFLEEFDEEDQDILMELIDRNERFLVMKRY